MSYAICEQQRLASAAEQASLSLTWSETPKDTFSHDEAHMHFNIFQLSHTLFLVYEPMKKDKKQITKIYEKAISAMHKIYEVSKTVTYSNILKLFVFSRNLIMSVKSMGFP